jgi:hypothetical protein
MNDRHITAVAPADPSHVRDRSRRAMLLGAIGGIGAWATSAVGRANPARAADPNDVVLGATNTTDDPTTIQTTLGELRPFVTILPTRETGPQGGLGPPVGLLADASGTQDGIAIRAKAKYFGYAIRAEDEFEGFALWGNSKAGFALYTAGGRIHFGGHSGIADIRVGSTRFTFTPGPVYPSSKLQLTPMVNVGSRAYWYTRDTGANTVTIHISSPMSIRARFSWFMVE